jgi:hypothetical protein
MQGTRKENALLFYVVVVPELRRKLQKSGRFCVESSVHFVPLDMAKQQERYPISYILSIVDRHPRSSFNVHRSSFFVLRSSFIVHCSLFIVQRSTFNVQQPTTNNQQPTTNNVLRKESSLFPCIFSSTPPRPLRSFFNG